MSSKWMETFAHIVYYVQCYLSTKICKTDLSSFVVYVVQAAQSITIFYVIFIDLLNLFHKSSLS